MTKTKTICDDSKFIFTKDSVTAENLITLGFKLISKTQNGYVFQNKNGMVLFSENIETKNILFTNKLFI